MSDGVKPPGRGSCVFEKYAGSLIIFGGQGFDVERGESVALNDLWRYSIKGEKWRQIIPASSLIPLARSGSGGVILNDTLFVFGGRFDNTTLTNELWKFSFITYKWVLCTPATSSDIPTPRTDVKLFIRHPESIRNGAPVELVIAGGLSQSGNAVSYPEIINLGPPENFHASSLSYTSEEIVLPSDSEGRTAVHRYSNVLWTGDGILVMNGKDAELSENHCCYIDLTDLSTPTLTFHPYADFITLAIPLAGEVGLHNSAILYGTDVYL